MIEHVYRRASAASRVHAVIVATDDERIATLSRVRRRRVDDARATTSAAPIASPRSSRSCPAARGQRAGR
jgi:CMP-2-keto-3-deoxyoctulosonic acid synthetase